MTFPYHKLIHRFSINTVKYRCVELKSQPYKDEVYKSIENSLKNIIKIINFLDTYHPDHEKTEYIKFSRDIHNIISDILCLLLTKNKENLPEIYDLFDKIIELSKNNLGVSEEEKRNFPGIYNGKFVLRDFLDAVRNRDIHTVREIHKEFNLNVNHVCFGNNYPLLVACANKDKLMIEWLIEKFNIMELAKSDISIWQEKYPEEYKFLMDNFSNN